MLWFQRLLYFSVLPWCVSKVHCFYSKRQGLKHIQTDLESEVVLLLNI